MLGAKLEHTIPDGLCLLWFILQTSSRDGQYFIAGGNVAGDY